MSYLERLKAEFSEKRLPGEPTKPTKAPSVSFVSAPSRHISEIEGANEPLLDLAAKPGATTQTDPELFTFAPPGDPANDAEAVAERAAITAVENGWTEAQVLQEARWQADRERCWRAFLRNAAHVLAAPEGERAELLSRYAAEASRRYGERTGADMVASLRGWVNARAVH